MIRRRLYFHCFAFACFALLLIASPQANGRSSDAPAHLTGAHWGSRADLATFKRVGYDFDVMTVDPKHPAEWNAALNAARANGVKLIIGGYPEPYSYDAARHRWKISRAGVKLLKFLARRSSLVLALFVYNEPYYFDPFTGKEKECGAVSAARLRSLRSKISSIWPQAKIYHDIGWPSEWAPGGEFYRDYRCIGNKYANARGVADYVGIWDYPFTTSGYAKAEALSRLNRESRYVVDSMGAIPVWLGQAHACCRVLTFPTSAQLLDWNCSIRNALPDGALISWYPWRQEIYKDYLVKHPEDWSLTTAAACSNATGQP